MTILESLRAATPTLPQRALFELVQRAVREIERLRQMLEERK